MLLASANAPVNEYRRAIETNDNTQGALDESALHAKALRAGKRKRRKLGAKEGPYRQANRVRTRRNDYEIAQLRQYVSK